MTPGPVVLLGSLEPGTAVDLLTDLLDGTALRSLMAGTTIVANFGGARERALRALAPVYVVHPGDEGASAAGTLQALGLDRVADVARGRALRSRLAVGDRPVLVPDLAGSRLLHWVRGTPSAITVCVALDGTQPSELDPGDRDLVLARATQWVTTSDAGALALASSGVAAERITVWRPDRDPDPPSRRRDARARLEAAGVPTERPLVAGGGTVDWSRTDDPFLDVAGAVARAHPDVHFAWACAGSSARMAAGLDRLLVASGLDHRVHVVTGDDSIGLCATAADVWVATAAHLRLPAGVSEAAAAGVPVVWFDPAGTGALPGPVADRAAMAARVSALLDGREVDAEGSHVRAHGLRALAELVARGAPDRRGL